MATNEDDLLDGLRPEFTPAKGQHVKQRKPKHFQSGADSCACGNLWPCTRTKPKKAPAPMAGVDHKSALYGISTIELGGKMTFIGKNRRLSPTFTHWWNGLCARRALVPNIEAAHKAYLADASISSYAAELDVIQSAARHRLENEALNTLHARVSPKIGAPQQDPRLKITRDALLSKILDTTRRLDRELAQLRQDLDRLRSFD